MNLRALGEGAVVKPCLLHGHTVVTLHKYLGLYPSNASRIVRHVDETTKKGTVQETRSTPGVRC